MDKFMCILVTACGVFCICGAYQNWNWFFNNYRARGIVYVLGRTGARIFYGVLGAVLMIIGIIALLSFC